MIKYGIMGGTFDPIHLGHLMIAQFVKEFLNLDKVIFIPTGNPPHKEKFTSADFRYNMTKLAINDNSDFIISDIETKLKDHSYSVDTVKKLKEIYFGKFYFIIGTDSLFMLETWKDLNELSKLVDFACLVRPGYDNRKDINSQMELLKNKYNSIIHLIDAPLYDISSTDIRKYISNGASVKYLVPDIVIGYIEKNGLYKG